MPSNLRLSLKAAFALAGLAAALVACDDATDIGSSTGGDPAAAAASEEGDFPINNATADEGKTGFGATVALDSKADSFENTPGPATNAGAADTEVWKVTAAWADRDTPAAKKAGMAWGADSGLSWDEKYAAWVDGMKPAEGAYGDATYTFATPYGKDLPAPAVECAETAILLRAAFASWYGLPFMLQGSDEHGSRVYLGHFGFRTANGRYANTPLFKTRYKDFTSRTDTWKTAGWPHDEALRLRHLGGNQDDEQPALSADASAGTWFDEAFLNKRVGYFMIFALSYFGSVNLADPVNTFNLKPEAMREGDFLLERWQKEGIGHTLVLKRVTEVAPDALSTELMSGSMPRRQAKWDSAASSRYYFLSEYTGGPEEEEPGVPYAALGGGLKRWRTPVVAAGHWTNIVPTTDRPNFIDASDLAAVGGRQATYETLLRDVPPEEKRQVLLGQIAEARTHLRAHPSSCSARERREDAFEALYDLESETESSTRTAVDKTNRGLEDYVFGELGYEKSKTCCWDSSTAAMGEIILAYADKEQADATAASTCVAPTVFRWETTGYQRWADFATSIGRGSEWPEWHEDEPCAQRAVAEDTVAEAGATPFCELK